MKSTQTGDLGELAFMLEAFSRGFVVSKPFGQSEGYDFIVDTGLKLLKVQVKAANWTKSKGEVRLKFKIAENMSELSEYCKKFDILACYDVELKIFYILPAADITVSSISFSSKTKAYSSKNNWSLFS